jgi:glutamate-1-semialdehyde 2,1-aminomutase
MQTKMSVFEQAKDVLVGGVNSPVRAYGSVGGDPVFVASGKGAKITSNTGTSYIDYVLSYGPLLGGHANESILADIHNALIKGTTFGAPTEKETALANAIRRFFPSCEKIRLVNSGTEATMSAIRLARGATKRPLIVKFDGHYHGHVDALLVGAGSGGLTLGQPSSAGIPPDVTKNTRVIPFNDCDALQRLFKQEGHNIAGLIMEPVCGNMGVVLPKKDFLQACQSECHRHGALLIFDEVMTGFRVGPSGAQGVFNITPDLTCLGKVIGGGLPLAAYGGRADVMSHLAPEGDVYQAGTLSGNPIAVSAGLATLQLIESYGIFDAAEKQTRRLVDGLRAVIHEFSAPMQVTAIGTMFTVFFSRHPIHSVVDVKLCDMAMFSRYFSHMNRHGILIPPSQFEANFVSSEHKDDIIDDTIDIVSRFIADTWPR